MRISALVAVAVLLSIGSPARSVEQTESYTANFTHAPAQADQFITSSPADGAHYFTSHGGSSIQFPQFNPSKGTLLRVEWTFDSTLEVDWGVQATGVGNGSIFSDGGGGWDGVWVHYRAGSVGRTAWDQFTGFQAPHPADDPTLVFDTVNGPASNTGFGGYGPDHDEWTFSPHSGYVGTGTWEVEFSTDIYNLVSANCTDPANPLWVQWMITTDCSGTLKITYVYDDGM